MNDSGYYIFGRATSCAWFLNESDAIEMCNKMNIYGNGYHVVKA